MQTADDLFRSELARRSLGYSIAPDGRYTVQVRDQVVTVSLDNIRRDCERDADAGAIGRFVDRIELAVSGETPDWDAVRLRVRYCLEPSNYEMDDPDDVLFRPINDELVQMFVYTNADGSQISWINKSMLPAWGVTEQGVVDQAERNMAAIVAGATLEVDEIGTSRLGWISTEEAPFKASLILSGAFRDLVSPTHGWPVCVVVPCRDYVYVIRDGDHELLGRIGSVVIEEYRNSGYPITKDVLQVSNDGIVAIGTYPEPE